MDLVFATLCFLRRDGKTLMLERAGKGDIHDTLFVAPGGKLEMKKQELPYECVVREIREESGYHIEHAVLRGTLFFDNRLRTFGGQQATQNWFVWVYTSGKFSGNLTRPKKGRFVWVEDENLLALKMHQGDRVFIPWVYHRSDYFHAPIIHQGTTFVRGPVDFYSDDGALMKNPQQFIESKYYQQLLRELQGA